MHKLHAKPITLDDFSTDHLTADGVKALEAFIDHLEKTRAAFVETKDKTLWYDMIQLLPSGYNQMRTVTLNYENLINIYYARRAHKLDEWHTLCDWILTLPYARDIITVREED